MPRPPLLLPQPPRDRHRQRSACLHRGHFQHPRRCDGAGVVGCLYELVRQKCQHLRLPQRRVRARTARGLTVRRRATFRAGDFPGEAAGPGGGWRRRRQRFGHKRPAITPLPPQARPTGRSPGSRLSTSFSPLPRAFAGAEATPLSRLR
ncbi:unnamed protein product [Ectocarpus sp. 8 AP-2014]